MYMIDIEKEKIKQELVNKLLKEIRITFFELDYMKSCVDLTDQENLDFYNKKDERLNELMMLSDVLINKPCELSDDTIEAINNKIKERGTDV